MKLHYYLKEDALFLFTRELSEFELIANDMRVPETTEHLENGLEWYANVQAALGQLFRLMSSETEEEKMRELLALFDEMKTPDR